MARPKRKPHTRNAFLALVILPTLVVALYTLLFASDQYVSETRFWVRGQKAAQPNVIGTMLGAPSSSATLEETLAVRDFILSNDAVALLEKRVDLRRVYGNSDIDYFNRLSADASAERLVSYHREMIELGHNLQSGIMTMRVAAYGGKEALALSTALLQMAEELINRFNERALQDALRVGREEVRVAEERVARIRQELTTFRDRARAIDPSQSTATVLSNIGALELRLANARTEFAEAKTYLAPDSQQIIALKTRIAALEAEIDREKSRLTGTDGALAPIVAEYEKLQLQRDFADKGLASALASLETARIEAQRQQMFIVRVVSPNEPQRPDWWRSWITVVSVFAGSLLMFGIGALMITATRDRSR
ncbi:MAG: hypothetical protein AB7G15_14015 [Alphaproteobacteria bacterium]